MYLFIHFIKMSITYYNEAIFNHLKMASDNTLSLVTYRNLYYNPFSFGCFIFYKEAL